MQTEKIAEMKTRVVIEPEPDDNAVETIAGAQSDKPIVAREMFQQTFIAAFTTAGAMSGLRSLMIAQDDQLAREAANALYDSALQVPALRFMIEEGSGWVQRGFVLIAFGTSIVRGVRAEIQERRALAVANENAPDSTGQ